ncbi:MAG: tRNA uridine-5-carboxymethylaminomethyl(34) synthesis GTPase MnmE [Acidobacteria bacterium]|nr:tRNA uridine-5-carboxymethylaminomethyl(34) synthesis GTPase MnmE [Acidobacteriota bacterium]
MELDDTIVAIATPPGRGGIGVIRISGPQARDIAAPLLRLPRALEPGRAIYGELVEPASKSSDSSSEGERLDEVVVIFFQKPHSYTTDDLIEISAHGSPVLLRHIVELAAERGARLAEPGEFTMRAFLNGRIDLTQAEAVRDLIESQTLYQAKVAAQQLDGALSRRLQPVKQRLVELIAVMEAGIDFADDDVPVAPAADILARIDAVQGPLAQLESSFAYGKVVHEGLTLAIVGRPNVGKSSLFNRLVQRERAIVTATPGTTRDLVTETVAIAGIPVRLVDTAGIRAAHDEAERMGVEKSYEALADADVVLVVIDAMAVDEERTAVDQQIMGRTNERKRLVALNKADLLAGGAATSLPISFNGPERVLTSAVTGQGIDELRAKIVELAGGGQQESGFITNVRHRGLLRDAMAALDAAWQSLANSIPHEMVLLDLYTALRALDAITGATTADDILNLIFSRFCIGK